MLEKKQKQNDYEMSLYINNYGVKGKFNKIGTFIPYSDYMDKVCELPAIVPVTQSEYAKTCFQLGLKDINKIREFYEYGEITCSNISFENKINDSMMQEILAELKGMKQNAK
jgi:hypothetical protein